MSLVVETEIIHADIKSPNPIHDALVLTVEPSLKIIHALRVGAHPVLKAGLHVGEAEVSGKEREGDQGDVVEVEVHVSIVPCGWGLSSKKQKLLAVTEAAVLDVHIGARADIGFLLESGDDLGKFLCHDFDLLLRDRSHAIIKNGGEVFQRCQALSDLVEIHLVPLVGGSGRGGSCTHIFTLIRHAL